MHEVIPYILILIGWVPDKGGESMALQHRLFASEEECKSHGTNFVEQRKALASEAHNATYNYYCIRLPHADEVRAITGSPK